MPRRGPEILFIETVSQMRAISAPLRIRMFEALARAAAPLSVREIARAVGRPAASLYRHLGVLRRAGLVRAAGRRGTGRKAEAVYAAAAHGLRSRPPRTAARRLAYARMGEAHARYALRCFSAAVRRGTARLNPPARDTAVRHLILNLSPGELAALNAELDALAMRWLGRAGHGTPNVSLAMVMGPLEKP
jgi:DNA-binding transcriptional ArsR family regulator